MRDTSVIDHYLAPLRPFLAPQSVTEPTSPKPVLRLRLPSPQVVGGLTLLGGQ